MTSLATRAEVIKLAREFHVDAGDLVFLQDAPPEAIRTFRSAVAAQLDAPHRPMFRRLGAASGLVPNSIAVAVATRYFGPMLCGMVSTEIGADRAAKLIGHVPVDFLADTAPYIDPGAAVSLIRQLPTETMMPTMQELLRRKDYVTLARFITAVTDEQLIDALPLVESGEDLLLTAFNAEGMDGFEVAMASLTEERIQSIIQAAVDHDQFAEALTFLPHLSVDTLRRVADATAAMGPTVLIAMVESAHRENAWAELVPVVAVMSPDNLAVQANLDVWNDENLTGAIEATRENDLWHSLRPLIAAMDTTRRGRLRDLPIVTELDVRAALGDLLE
ncbi:hypothetical protein OG921_22320 [Aldersonia sp. NBC_00410]|uniref:hypothetical protein n=1 Tax=Aldersonia sp. NBC_00410 TaxID=2975954 RepID=UPI0022539FEB|nr:hypothetical protein [Aldersonia sp. NBC_00410]MCX5045908.1 hypothetical protein [Aldersonia sp. NBC_00410]